MCSLSVTERKIWSTTSYRCRPISKCINRYDWLWVWDTGGMTCMTGAMWEYSRKHSARKKKLYKNILADFINNKYRWEIEDNTLTKTRGEKPANADIPFSQSPAIIQMDIFHVSSLFAKSNNTAVIWLWAFVHFWHSLQKYNHYW